MAITINGTTGIAGVDGSASTPAVQGTDTNTGIVFPSADTVAVSTGGSERMRITSTGELLVGGTTSVNSDRPAITLQGTGATILGFFRDDTTISSGNGFGQIIFYGNDTTSNTPVGHAAIVAIASGTHGPGDNPSDIYFSTTPSGSATMTERMRITAAGNLQFNSGYGSVATAYGCRAWVNFNGTSTVAIRGSGNVTSITDNGTGDYTVNFTTAMPDANYNYSTGAQQNAAGTNTTYTTKKFGGTVTTSAFQIVSISGDRSGFQDNDYISVSFFR